MLGQLLAKVIGTQNDRELKRLRPLVDRVNSFEESIKRLSDTELRAKTVEFRERLGHGGPNDLLPEAFAVVREAGRRVLDMRHYDVQLIGGMVLHRRHRRDEDGRRQDARRDAPISTRSKARGSTSSR